MTDQRKSGGPVLAIFIIALALAIILLQGCTVGPDYARPEVDLPKDYATAQSSVEPAQDWWKVFHDPVLDRLEEEALASNRDLRAAAERVLQARATLSITRSDQLPQAGVSANHNRTRTSSIGAVPLPADFLETNDNRVVAQFSWELDFWGKYRRATEASRADLVASEAGRDAVRTSLVSDVARGYFALLAYDQRVETLDRTRQSWAEALDLQKVRWDAGAVSELEYRQIESQLHAAEAFLPAMRLARAKQESALMILLGRAPREVFQASVDRGKIDMPDKVEVPAGMPSDLLLRRPDLRQAEAQLHAANARIGVARAAYFPDISLTGYVGSESVALKDLFTGPARTWSLAGNLLQPLYAGGQIRGGVDLAESRTREAVEYYQKTVANAFREVRDAIVAQGELREAWVKQNERELSYSRTLDLARIRYQNGTINLFDLLDTERQLLAARLDAIDAERDRRDAIVELYTAMGA
ncbi:MAG TPA: efflux transporter outer membrane subunit [Usitatibacter sp.]|nr:efflux transporter outer membrane subunit [Usitatibacter sp.]